MFVRSSRFVLLFSLACLAALPSPAQLPHLPAAAEAEPGSPPAEQMPTEDGVMARRAELRRAIEAARGTDRADGEAAGQARVVRLEGIDRLLALQLTELRRPGRPLEEALPDSLETRFEHPPPYAVGELDQFLDELEAATAAREVSSSASQAAGSAVDSARRRLEELETPAPTREPAELDLEIEAAIEQLRLRRLQQQGAERDLEYWRTIERRLAAQVRELRAQLVAASPELEELLAELAAEAVRVERELDAARERLETAADRWTVLEEQVELAARPGAGLLARAEASRLEAAAAQNEVALLGRQLEWIDRVESDWRLRFRVLAGGVAAGELSSAAREAEDRRQELDRERRLIEARLEERRLALGVLRDQQQVEADARVRRWLNEQEKHLLAVVTLYEQEHADLSSALRLASRLEHELETRAGEISVGERFSLLWQRLRGASGYVITSADGQDITIGKVVLALLLILIGYVVSRVLSRRLGRSILPRFGITRGAAVAFQTLAFYGLFAVFFLWALRLVEIPLTLFTVVGGVLAIGIGFGSQNIMNNFISGLIILAEHPIKVGDLVDVDGVFGQVERIGPRSSRIRAGDNTHVIVPNSAFLEKNVLNWTVSDDVIRTWVDVGVAYGSPVEEVAEGLQRAVAEEPGVLEEPEPEILFMDFGDNALAFRAYFWVKVARSLDRFRFQSRLRFRIDRIFREAGIVIAFPQRDVHLDSLSPLEIRMVADRPEAPGASPE